MSSRLATNDAPSPLDALAAPAAGLSSQSRLDALCAAGAERVDPVAVRTLRILGSRIAGQPEPVRRLLQEKFERALQELARRLRDAPGAAPAPQRAATRRLTAERTPLGQLTEALPASPGRSDPAATRSIAVRDELRSVDRFRRAWAAVRAQEQVAQGATRMPTNAGPLNSHALVLQTLSLMQALSPDYLAHFLRHVESLQWLEQVQAARAAVAARSTGAVKSARRSSTKKK